MTHSFPINNSLLAKTTLIVTNMKILKRLIQSRKNSVAKATGTAMALAAFALFSTSCSDSTTEMAETVEPTKIVFISGDKCHRKTGLFRDGGVIRQGLAS